jgi:hypothetical protein
LNEVLDLIINGEKPQFDKEKLLEKLKSDHFPVGYPLLEIIHPTVSEANSLSYLLATERIQVTGQDNLSLNDCELDHKGVQFVQFDKPRSSKKSKISAHYASVTHIYDVYKTWKEGSIKYHEIYENGARKDKFNFLLVEQIGDKMKIFSLPSALYYTPLFFNSLSRKEAIKEESRCELYMDSMVDAYKVMSNTIRKQKNGKNYTLKTVRPSLNVGINALSQTRALLESKPIDGLDTEANDLLDASLSAHTPGVKKDVYKSRARSNCVVKSGFEFSKSVSDKMIDDANRVAKLLERTKVVTLKDLEIQLGIQSPFDKYSESESINKLLDEAEKNGYTVGAIAELNNDGKTIVICTPLVAALILGEIRHIDSHIDDLKNINPFKVNQYKTRKIFLHEVIDSFPNKIIKEGKEMLSKYNFPYPPLS